MNSSVRLGARARRPFTKRGYVSGGIRVALEQCLGFSVHDQTGRVDVQIDAREIAQFAKFFRCELDAFSAPADQDVDVLHLAGAQCL